MKPGRKFPLSAEELRSLYVDQRLSTIKIGQICDRNCGNVSRALKAYGIPSRTSSEGVAISWEGNEERRQWAAENLRGHAIEHYTKGVATRAAQYRENPSPWERLAIDFFRQHGVPFEFQVQFGIYIADFVLPHRSLIIEIDTEHHRIPQIAERDKRRTAYLNEQGYTVHRILGTSKRGTERFFVDLETTLP